MRMPTALTLTDEFDRFEADLRSLALEIADAVLRRELKRKLAEQGPGRGAGRGAGREAGRGSGRAPGRGAGRGPEKKSAPSSGRQPKARSGRPLPRAAHKQEESSPPKPRRRTRPQLELQLASATAASPGAVENPNAVPSTPEPSPAAAADAADHPSAGAAGLPSSVVGAGKRRRWTREDIIEELARWMVSGTVIDAQFVTRHGPPGLVAAARRIFGRFDAALNVASLHVTTLYPDGPPPLRGAPPRRG